MAGGGAQPAIHLFGKKDPALMEEGEAELSESGTSTCTSLSYGNCELVTVCSPSVSLNSPYI